MIDPSSGPEKDTVSIHFVRSAIQRLDGSARAGVLARAGIAQELLSNMNARVSAQAFASLWQSVSRELDDEFFGLGTRPMREGSFALLCQAALHGRNLGHATRRYLRGFSLFVDELTAELVVEDQTAEIRLRNGISDPGARLFADETWMVMAHGLMCWLCGQRIQVSVLKMAHSKPVHWREYSVMFSQNLTFDAPSTSMTFDAGLLEAPIVQTEATLRNFLKTAPQSVFLKYKNYDDWTPTIRRRLRDSPDYANWPVLSELAGEFGVSISTLRRKLESEGSSYQAIKDALRRDAAIHYLCHTDLSVFEISHHLGFQEPSAFHRAFKKWCGAQPGEYRLRRIGGN